MMGSLDRQNKKKCICLERTWLIIIVLCDSGVVCNPLHPHISMHILHTVLHTFPEVLMRRICLTIKSIFRWWSFLLFLWPSCLIQGWYCKEKLDARHSWGQKGSSPSIEDLFNLGFRLEIQSPFLHDCSLWHVKNDYNIDFYWTPLTLIVDDLLQNEDRGPHYLRGAWVKRNNAVAKFTWKQTDIC